MNMNFSEAMTRATRLTHAGNAAQATRIIQEALSGQHKTRSRGVPAHVRIGLPRPMIELNPANVAPETSARPPQGSASRPRMPLGDVLKTLRQGRAALNLSALPGMNPPASAPPPMPETARYLRRSFTCGAGARDFRLYLPACLPQSPRGLIVMLHGCTQNPEDFATGTNMNALAEEHGLAVAWPEQTRAHNASACWNWFRPGDQRRDAGEPAILAGITRKAAAEFNVAPGRIFAAGLSSGGAMAAILGETWPDLFSAIGVHSGLTPGCASDVVSAFAAMRGDAREMPRHRNAAGAPRLIVFHGSADSTVHFSNGERLFEAARGSRISQDHRAAAPGGRSYTRSRIIATDGGIHAEHWLIEGAEHAWSGGQAGGSHTDPAGPDASKEMLRFFLKTSK